MTTTLTITMKSKMFIYTVMPHKHTKVCTYLWVYINCSSWLLHIHSSLQDWYARLRCSRDEYHNALAILPINTHYVISANYYSIGFLYTLFILQYPTDLVSVYLTNYCEWKFTHKYLGPVWKTVSPGTAIPMITIQQSWNRVNFDIGSLDW